MQIEPYLPPCPKFNYKWAKNLNLRPDILNLREKKENSFLINLYMKRFPEQDLLSTGTKKSN